MNGVHPSRRNIAIRSYVLYPNMTVGKIITFGIEMHAMLKAERATALDKVAEVLQIMPLLKRKPGQLPGGQRQRITMGRALVRNPDVFMASSIGSPSKNLIPAIPSRARTTAMAEIIDAADAPVLLPVALEQGAEGAVVLLGIRSEAVTNPDGADKKARNVVLV